MEETENKEKIVKGAMELFMKYGIRSVSMDDIARHLSISKKTIYHFFADKEDVVTVGSQELMDKIKGDFDLIHKKSKNAIDELVGISRQLKKVISEVNQSMLFDIQKYHPKAWAGWLEHKNVHVKESITRNLLQGIEEGFFRPELNTDIIAKLRLEQVQIAFDGKVFSQDEFDITDVQLQILDHFVYGLLTEKGRKLYEEYKLEMKEHEMIPTHKHN